MVEGRFAKVPDMTTKTAMPVQMLYSPETIRNLGNLLGYKLLLITDRNPYTVNPMPPSLWTLNDIDGQYQLGP